MISEEKIKPLKSAVYVFAEFRLEEENLLLFRNSEVVSLAPKASGVLLALVKAQGRMLTRQEILETVWADTFVEEANLTHHISMLRKALGEDGDGRKFIETIPRKGYRFAAAVRKEENDAGSAEIVFHERTAVRLTEETTIEIADTPAVIHRAGHSTAALPLQSTANRRRRTFQTAAATLLILMIGAAYFGRQYLNFSKNTPPSGPPEISIKRLTPDADAAAPAISPDGASVVYARDENGRETLWRKQIATGELTQLLPAVPMPESRIVATRFSPDGRWLYYRKFIAADPSVVLFRMPASGGAEQKILADSFESDFSISPDGRQIAYTFDWRQLIVFDIETGSKRIVAERDGSNRVIKSEENSVAWSPDGKSLIFSAGVTENGRNLQQMFAINLATGEERQLPVPEDFQARQIEWPADGSDLFVTRGWMVNQIWRVNPRTGAVRRLSNETANFKNLRLSADGQKLVAEQNLGQYNLWTAPAGELDKKRQITIGASAIQGAHGLALMPDGKIVYTSPESGTYDLWSINPDGTGRRQLTVNASYNDSPKLTHDGQYLVFRSGRSGTAQVWRMETDGGNPVQLSRATEIVGFSLSAADEVYYQVYSADRGKYQTYKVPAAGGEPIEFNDRNFDELPRFSPDGKWYVSFNHESEGEKPRAGLVETATGKIVRYFDTPIASYGWAPDSKALIHTLADGSQLWRLPIAGGPAQKIADFSPLKIANWNFSPDGGRAVFSLGNSTNEIVAVSNFSEAAQ